MYKKSYKPRPRIRKRWYVDASVPKSMPFIGGSSFKAGSGVLRKRSLQTMIRSSGVESHGQKNGASNLLQATVQTFNPLGNIPIGTGDINRVGTDIFVKKITFKMDCVLPSSLNTDVYIRLAWVRSTKQVQGGVDSLASGLGVSDLQYSDAITKTGEIHLNPLDPEKVTILADKLFLIPMQSNSSSGSFSHRVLDFPCPITNFPFKYEGAASNYSTKNKNLYLIAIAYANGVSTATPLMTNRHSSLVTFNESS